MLCRASISNWTQSVSPSPEPRTAAKSRDSTAGTSADRAGLPRLHIRTREHRRAAVSVAGVECGSESSATTTVASSSSHEFRFRRLHSNTGHAGIAAPVFDAVCE